ncbi:hypothetical protein CH364_18590 [Leptospira harrisiae]|uniref:Uncharacterized protein n=1 Tax=Leptospira harrisiae TaxID=2023189 RepID=A0A2N0AFA6_9LEPT|nr:hypothetical protein CH364_18590 [Leptospira harrisiae]
MKIDEGTYLTRSDNYFADGRVVPGYYIFSGRNLSVIYYHPYLFSKSRESLLLYTGMVDPKTSANSIFANYGNFKDVFPIKSVTPFFEFNLPGIFFLSENKKLMYLNIR